MEFEYDCLPSVTLFSELSVESLKKNKAHFDVWFLSSHPMHEASFGPPCSVKQTESTVSFVEPKQQQQQQKTCSTAIFSTVSINTSVTGAVVANTSTYNGNKRLSGALSMPVRLAVQQDDAEMVDGDSDGDEVGNTRPVNNRCNKIINNNNN